MVKAVKLGSAAKAIKWYYQTYRPEDFKSHNEKKDWKKNCRIGYTKIQKWMAKYNKTGYHRRIIRMERPESGLNCISPITLTPFQQNMMVNTALEGGGTRKAIKDRVKIGQLKDYILTI